MNGSWGDKHNEDPVVGPLAKSFASASTTGTATARARTGWPGNVFEDADDLVALVDKLGLAPARIASDSGGVAVVLRAATRAMAAGVVANFGSCEVARACSRS